MGVKEAPKEVDQEEVNEDGEVNYKKGAQFGDVSFSTSCMLCSCKQVPMSLNTHLTCPSLICAAYERQE